MIEEKIRRAERAHSLITDPLMVEAYEAVETALIERWKVSKDQGERERIWLSQGLLRKLWGELETIIGTGKMAKAELDALVAEDKRKKRFGVI